jgi:hypothetical protein
MKAGSYKSGRWASLAFMYIGHMDSHCIAYNCNGLNNIITILLLYIIIIMINIMTS